LRHIRGMKHFLFAIWPFVAALAWPVLVSAGEDPPRAPLFTWNLLWAGSWEEGGNLENRGDFRLGLARRELLLRAQALDRRPLDFDSELPWADFSQRTAGGFSFGLYHGPTGSRLLYGGLHEQGLPARIRSPWSRSAPYAENRRPSSAELRTASSASVVPEAYLYLSGPRFGLFGAGSVRSFASARVSAEGELRPAFSGGLEAFAGRANVLLEGFFTGSELPARESSAWFGDRPPLPARDFRLGAASLTVATPRLLFACDFALSNTFAYGSGFYGNAAFRFVPPASWLPWFSGLERGRSGAGPWSLSLAVEGVGGRYVGRDGANIAEGFRAAGRIERRGPGSGLFRAETGFRAPCFYGPFDRSSFGVSYRFPTLSARAAADGVFPLRTSRASLSSERNASNPENIRDGVSGTLGLSLNLPPMLLPPALLPPQSRLAAQRPRVYPLGITLSASLWTAASSEGPTSPYPFFAPAGEFASARAGCELLWSPGIFQLRTRWYYAVRHDGDGTLEGSFSVAARLGRGRFSARVAWPDFPEKRSYTLSWRVEK